ncbi:aromatic ring-hydroxylating oxygenase subunit alpha [Brevibacillus sp. B_LB10_24]|uniref:aromatic ring-hydroxylating oxygenase subunit alpha n=1 Tax=Brevibacillus sp. B_LB10_24 TaxID=3380645 RepID=UPI0038B7F563
MSNLTESQEAKTLAYRSYVDADVFQEEQQKIFARSWHYVGHASQLQKAGDFFRFEAAGEPILVTRGQDGEIRAFYNVCPHRGAEVEAKECGNKKILQCPYHGWTFTLDGKLHKAPNFKEDSPCTEHAQLRAIRLEVHHSFIFVNLDESASSFAEEYRDWLRELGRFSFLDRLKRVHFFTRMIKSNWKAVVDNYLECDHCPIAHPGFAATFDLSQYKIVNCENYTYQYGDIKEGVEGAYGDNKTSRFYWVWPNMFASFYPQSNCVTTSQILPIDAHNTLAVYATFFENEELTKEQEEMIRFVNQVREEDFGLVESLQIGLRSRAFPQGLYSPTEHGLRYFHSKIRSAMSQT